MIPAPNLIPPARLRARRSLGAARAWCVVNAGAVVVLGATWAALAGSRDLGTERIRAQIAEVNRAVTDTQADLKRSSAELVALTRQLAAVPDVADRPPWALLLSALASVRGQDVALVSLDLTPALATPGRPVAQRPGLPPRYQLRLSGLARDHRSATGFSLAVERTGLFSQVRLTDATARSVSGTPAVAFSIECVLDDAGEAQ